MYFLLFFIRGKKNGTMLGHLKVSRNTCLVDINYPLDILGHFHLYLNVKPFKIRS